MSLDHDLNQAFKKLLSFVYYDKSGTMLHLRERMAKRISKGQKEEVISNVKELLKSSNKISNYLDEIGVRLIPKSVKNNHEDDIVLTNDRVSEKNEVSGINLMFDAPVEIFILSVYWLMRYGYKLDKKLGDYCYGNRLLLNENKDDIRQGRALLKPYIHQYQMWRDNAIRIAKKQLEEDVDVGFINLDITKFYYNVRLDWEKIAEDLGVNNRSPIHKCMYSIHEHYTKLVADKFGSIFNLQKEEFSESKRTILPIGLPSSYTLANYHLIKFDKDVVGKVKPIYYGRYVDDILLVIQKPSPSQITDENFYMSVFEKIEEEEKEKVPRSTKFIYNNLNDIFSIKYDVNSADIKDPKNYKFEFRSESLETLYIQNKKIMVYEFRADQSLSVIEKLKHDLDERSSEFRFLPTMEDANFDKDAFHLLFDDSFGKPRTLKDYKENRFGIASYLYKRSAVALWSTKTEMYDEANKILAFFKGSNIVRFYQQWERLFTYFVIAGRMKELVQLTDNIFEEISKIEFDQDDFTIKDEEEKKLKDTLKKDLENIFVTSLSQAFSLDPTFLKNNWFKSRLENSSFRNAKDLSLIFIPNRIEKLTVQLRKSYLVRHYFIYHPLLEYTSYSQANSFEDLLPLTGKSFDFDEFTSGDLTIKPKVEKIDFPRFVKFFEVCIHLFRYRVLVDKSRYKDSTTHYSRLFFAEDYLEKAWKCYSQINFGNQHGGTDQNGKSRKSVFFKAYPKPVKSITDDSALITEIHVNDSGEVNKDYFTLALANIKVNWEKEAENGLKNRPNKISIERQQRFSRLLNKLTEEKKYAPDLFILPEISVPNDLIQLLCFYGMKHQTALLFGTEHIRAGNLGFNFINSVLPVRINDEMVDAIFLPRLKNHYSHQEKVEIESHQLSPVFLRNHIII